MTLKLIKTEAENAAALERLGRLMAAAPAEGTPESDEMLALGALIRQFEEARYRFDKPDPVAAIRFRMEQKELRPTDMAPYFGTVSRFYEVMTGSRNLTLAMIRKLNRNLGIPAEVLIRDPKSSAEYPTDSSPICAMHDAESAPPPPQSAKPTQQLQIRNGTAEFLIFTRQTGEGGIEVRVEDETVWLTQKLMAALFAVDVRTINEHLGNVYGDGEQRREATVRKFRIVHLEGSREVAREVDHYNLDAIIAVGFRVNSARAIQFRQWAAGVLRDFAIRGYVLDKERLKNGAFFSKEYYNNLLAEIREIRASERNFYQKITDIYATALDYSPDAETTRDFFATVQNKLHFAIHGRTAAELIVARADSAKDRMGLTTWKNAPHGKIIKPDVVVAKNYLTEKELKSLDRFVTMYLDYAESQAERNIPMTMQDWARKLNAFLQFNEKEVLDNPGKVSQEVAKVFAESEFEKYRIVQDRRIESDFDRQIKKLLAEVKTDNPRAASARK